MSLFSMMGSIDPAKLSDQVFEDDNANACLMPMGITSENVAKEFGVTRLQQDTLAYESH
jgi:acetyl-CoA acyltransferase 1